MKNFKLFFFTLLLGCIIFNSCSDDNKDGNERPPYNYNPMKGTWQKQNDRTKRMIFNASFQILEGTLSSEGEYVYNRTCDRYWVDFTYYNATDSVNGKAIVTGVWDYTMESPDSTLTVLKIKKQGSGGSWESYNRVN